LRRPAAALLGVAGLLALATPARAEAWRLDPAIELQARRNSNQDLVTPSPGAVDVVSLWAGLVAARASEIAHTSVDLGLRRAIAQGPGQHDDAEARLTLAQNWTWTSDSVDISLQVRRDSTYEAAGAAPLASTTSADAVDRSLGRGGRRVASAQTGWGHQLDELSSLSLQLTGSRTRYASELVQASDYADRAATLSLSRRISELASLTAQVTRSEFDTLDSNSSSRTMSYSLGFDRALGETRTIRAGLGLDHSRSSSLQPVRVCPLQPALCNAGLVAPVLVLQRGDASRWSRQYNAGWSERPDEATDVDLAVSRRISPSGLGSMVLSSNFSAGLSRNFGPRLSGRLAYARSRTEFPGAANAPRPGLQSLDTSLSCQLDPTLKLSASWTHQRADEPRAGLAARGDTFGLTLRHEWPRVEFSR
jgi:hypothetical protein